jgi:iron(III) transport system permease protein
MASILSSLKKLQLSKQRLRLGTLDWGSTIIFVGASGLLLYFMAYPIVLVIADAFRDQGTLSLQNFVIFWSNRFYRSGLINSLVLATLSIAATTLIGLPLAYLIVRYDFPGKKWFSGLSILPMVIPPFVGALGLRWVLGNAGMVNLLLQDLNLIKDPIPFLFFRIPLNLLGTPFDIHLGLTMIEALHLYPIIYLNTAAALANIDPSLEEQAENLGAKGFRLFRTVTLPLLQPGYVAGAVLVFIWVLTDLGTPLIIGYNPVIVNQLYSVALESYYQSPIAYVMCVIITAISLFIVAIYRRYTGRKEYAKIQAGASVSRPAKRLHGFKLAVCYVFLSFLILAALAPHIGIFLAAFTREWSRTILPSSYTLENFELIFSNGLNYIKNSFLYCSIVFLVNIFLGAAIGFILVRKKIPGKEIMDYLSMLPLAVPGIVVGIGYWRAWLGTPLDPFYMTALILTISLTMRRLPFTVRASYAGMLQIPNEYEEASLNLGASRWRTFRSIILPLLLASLIAGGILAFTYAMLEISTTLILVSRGDQATMTWGIFQYMNDPRYGMNVASAMGALLIVLVSASLLIASRIFGKQMGALFRFG